MFDLTKQERLVLISLAVIFLTGSTSHYALKKNSRLNQWVNMVDSEKLYKPLNINKVNLKELMRVPHIGEVTAKRILSYREGQGRFKDISELKSVLGIGSAYYPEIIKFLAVYPDK